MSSDIVTPAEVHVLSERHAMLIDIRGHDEWLREHIYGARSLPLEQLQPGCFSEGSLSESDTVVFLCQSGMRTNSATAHLRNAVHPAKALIMQGGLNAWKAAGYPVQVDSRQPLPVMRQVQITAGALVLCGTVAGAVLSPAFYIIPGFVGPGLMFAGITGWCGMAKFLAVMPWNR
ncbi:rhodanese family protein [Lelliottia wanjuensis]|uniref:Rhodanese family protein n=1 Tax=Lelliottia wanjuensis TaxID=3050585 RepID=A0AAP4FV38_9ENTR|nr:MULTISPECIES: rhodanese family protein [unclassified Lelliottia]MDK9361864.1 rhodanese family protein [Lelliottia sp. V106_12]MDK9584407.1 rhodanese family protein [Lelliottia sp. V86_10]MDK9617264.1 rhodanese family protein [Lelliottia sp. V106_9]